MKEKVDSMLHWVELGLGLSMGSVGLKASVFGKHKATIFDGLDNFLGSKSVEALKFKKKGFRAGLG